MMNDLAAEIEAAIDEDERDLKNGPWPQWNIPPTELAKRIRKVQRQIEGHRRILARHRPLADGDPWPEGARPGDCMACGVTWPCDDARDMASIYRIEPPTEAERNERAARRHRAEARRKCWEYETYERLKAQFEPAGTGDEIPDGSQSPADCSEYMRYYQPVMGKSDTGGNNQR